MALHHIDPPGELPLPLLKRALPGATNDEMLELAYQVLENLSERAESAADFAIDSDNRDVENEALVLVKEVESMLVPYGNPRLRESWYRVHDAEQDLEKATRNRRARLEGDTALEQFSHRRSRRVQSAWEVERRRERLRSDKLVEGANITPQRVWKALVSASTKHGGEVQALDVAIALMPELTDTSVVGRQRVINRVSQVMRAFVRENRLAQIKPDDTDGGRKTCRYALAMEGDDVR